MTESVKIDFVEWFKILEHGRKHGLKTKWCLSFNGQEIDTVKKLFEPHGLNIDTIRYRIFLQCLDLEVYRLEEQPKTWFDLWTILDELVQDSGEMDYHYLEYLEDLGYGDFELKTGC